MAKKLSTDRGCYSAKAGPDGARIDYAIHACPGMRLRVTEDRWGNFSKVWSLLYTRKNDGKKCRVNFGNYPAVSLSEARSLAIQYRGAVFSGSDPAANIRGQKQAPTFAELSEQWLELYSKRNRSTYPEDRRTLEKDVLPIVGSIKAENLTKSDIRAVTDKIVARNAGYHANRTYELCRAIFNWGERNDIVTNNPVIGLDRPVIEVSRERKLSASEIRVFWNILDGSAMWEGTRDVLRLCLLLGQRVNEVAQAPKAEFDFEAEVWTIPTTRTKNKQTHRLPLPENAFKIIKNSFIRAPSSRFAFPTPQLALGDRPMTEGAVSRAWVRARKPVSDLSDFRVHDLRRSFASIAGDCGIHDFEIGLVLNHGGARAKATSIYNRSTYDEPKRKVLEAVESVILKQVA